jgi:hypothetical protein
MVLLAVVEAVVEAVVLLGCLLGIAPHVQTEAITSHLHPLSGLELVGYV